MQGPFRYSATAVHGPPLVQTIGRETNDAHHEDEAQVDRGSIHHVPVESSLATVVARNARRPYPASVTMTPGWSLNFLPFSSIPEQVSMDFARSRSVHT